MNENEIIITDEMYEKLKTELFIWGIEAIEDFLDMEVPDYYEKDTIDNMMDDVLDQMPDDVFMDFYNKYCNTQEMELE